MVAASLLSEEEEECNVVIGKEEVWKLLLWREGMVVVVARYGCIPKGNARVEVHDDAWMMRSHTAKEVNVLE